MPHTAESFSFLPPDRGFPVFLEPVDSPINCSKLTDLDERVNEYWNAAEINLSFDIDITAAPGKVDYANSEVVGYDALKYFAVKSNSDLQPTKPILESGSSRVPPNKPQFPSFNSNLVANEMRVQFADGSRFANGGMFIFEDGLYYSITISKSPEFLITSDKNVSQYMVANQSGTSSSFNVSYSGKNGTKTFSWYLVSKNLWSFQVNSATMSVEYFTY